MNLNGYVVGGISEALHSKKEKVDVKESEDEVLTTLFSFKPPVSTEESADVNTTIDEETIKQYINPSAEESLPAKNITTKKVKKNKILGNKDGETKKWEEESKERKERTVFVGNVALSVKKKTLIKLFRKYGDIESLRIRSIPISDAKVPRKVAYIKKEFHTDRNSMNAYVVFKEKSNAEKALECNGLLLESLHLRVDLSENKKHDTTRSLFIGNLPFNTEEDKLREHFSQCGNVEDVRIIRDRKTGLGKGFAYVKFQDKSGVMFGLKLNSSEFEGRTLRVFRAQDQNKENTGSHSNKSFRGLRSTSKKDVKQLGKNIFNTKNTRKSTNKTNSLRRLKDKKLKQNKKIQKDKKIAKKERTKEKYKNKK